MPVRLLPATDIGRQRFCLSSYLPVKMIEEFLKESVHFKSVEDCSDLLPGFNGGSIKLAIGTERFTS